MTLAIIIKDLKSKAVRLDPDKALVLGNELHRINDLEVRCQEARSTIDNSP